MKNKSQKEVFVIPTETDNSFDENLAKRGRMSHSNNNNNTSSNYMNNNNCRNSSNNYGYDGGDRNDYSNYDDNDEMTIDSPPVEMKKEVKKEMKKKLASSEKEKSDMKGENNQKLRNKLLHFDMLLNRACGVVGGRSVTMPESEVSW